MRMMTMVLATCRGSTRRILPASCKGSSRCCFRCARLRCYGRAAAWTACEEHWNGEDVNQVNQEEEEEEEEPCGPCSKQQARCAPLPNSGGLTQFEGQEQAGTSAG